MKSLKILICSVFITGSLYAQQVKETDVPVSVKEKFYSMYPAGMNAEWEKEGENFEASVNLNNIETSLIFTVEGKLLKTEFEIPVSQLPEKVRDYLTNNLKAEKIDEAVMIVDDEGSESYQVEINGIDYLFSGDGKLLNNGSDRSLKNEYDSD